MKNSQLKIIDQYKSPNFDDRPKDIIISSVIIHYTEMSDHLVAIDRLCSKEAKVSAHYLIDKNGEIYNLVPDKFRAWHAGKSYWDGKFQVNDFSIGIELDNNGAEDFSNELMKSLILLCQYICKNHPIRADYILGHSDIAPERKIDPGRKFNWQLLYEAGIGIMPKNETLNNIENSLCLIDIQKKLQILGYNINPTGELDQQTQCVIRAFNDHFYQENILNQIDEIFFIKLEQLLLAKKRLI